MITLRPYQSEGIQRIRDAFVSGAQAPLYVLPTGAGKSVIFSAIAESSEKRAKRVLILAHRVELVDQIVSALDAFDVRPDIIAAGYSRRKGRVTGHSTTRPIAVASVQTLINRMDDYPEPTLIICDEAHHVAGGNMWSQIIRRYRTAKVLGVTATPVRLDGCGLGSQFDRLLIGPSVSELIAGGYLAKPRVFAPPSVDTSGLHVRAGDFKADESSALMDVPSITGDALAHYKKHGERQPALIFCTSVAHAHHVAEKFRLHGIPSIALDAGTSHDVRRMAVKDFRDKKILALASCDLFSEGFDAPGVHIGIMLRPTASLGLFLQQVGRVLRPADGKQYATILDHAGNTQRHGLPDEYREWALDKDIAPKKKPDNTSIKVCPKCFAASPSRAAFCVECKHEFEVKPRQSLTEKEGELVEITAVELAKKRERREQGRAATLEQLKEIARIKGHKPGWAEHVLAGRMAKANKGG